MPIGIDASRLGTMARTGTERYTFEVVGAMARLDRQTPYTLYCNGLPASLPRLGTNFALRNIPWPRLWTHLRLAWEMQRRPPDVLFVPSHVLPVIHPPRSVVTIHDLGYLAFPQAHTAARRLELHLSTLWSARASRQLIAVSRATRDALVSHYRVDAAKIRVIPHGVAPHFRPVEDPSRMAATLSRYGMDRIGGIGANYLLYVGTVQPRKNLVHLIDSFAQVVRGAGANGGGSGGGRRDLHLVIAGKRGWMTAAIEQRAAEQDIAGRVHFVGYVDDADLPVLMSGALAFVFPSLYEGFGMPVLEAMACGTPVLTSTTTSLPEVAGDAALLVNPHDPQAIARGLTRLVDDEELRATLHTRGVERATLFTWERCARETLQVLGV
ncbi:MAG: glycosyltransferase family 4 protein [Chloroflexaceae bacterium]|nr:glycosyltransferase family 4 protein [Chloroflexaceae bacterium]